MNFEKPEYKITEYVDAILNNRKAALSGGFFLPFFPLKNSSKFFQKYT